MNEKEILWTIVASGVPILGAIIVMMKPIITLTSSIAELNSSIVALRTELTTQNTRITKHSEEIDSLKVVTTNHEVRITNLERGGVHYESK